MCCRCGKWWVVAGEKPTCVAAAVGEGGTDPASLVVLCAGLAGQEFGEEAGELQREHSSRVELLLLLWVPTGCGLATGILTVVFPVCFSPGDVVDKFSRSGDSAEDSIWSGSIYCCLTKKIDVAHWLLISPTDDQNHTLKISYIFFQSNIGSEPGKNIETERKCTDYNKIKLGFN